MRKVSLPEAKHRCLLGQGKDCCCLLLLDMNGFYCAKGTAMGSEMISMKDKKTSQRIGCVQDES
jgi:hypothetical protein